VNTAVHERNGTGIQAPKKKMGTTMVAMLQLDDRIQWVHVGDSRIFRITREGIDQVTEDHNVGTRDFKAGVATFLDAFRSPVAKHLTQALGPRPSKFVVPDAECVDVACDTAYLLCSDGLTDMVLDDELLQVVLDHWEDPDAAVARLVGMANDGGGVDNITIILVRITPRPVFVAAEPAG
jgi:protein phosphatase